MLAVAVALLTATAACGGSSQIGELRTQIEDVLRGEFPELRVNDVNCGDPDPSLDPGSIFFCTAGVEGGRIRVQVTIDADGVARYERLNALVDLDRLELEIATDLEAGLGFPVGVDCGDGFSVEEVGAEFVCVVSASGDSRGARVTVADIDANTTYRFPVAIPG